MNFAVPELAQKQFDECWEQGEKIAQEEMIAEGDKAKDLDWSRGDIAQSEIAERIDDGAFDAFLPFEIEGARGVNRDIQRRFVLRQLFPSTSGAKGTRDFSPPPPEIPAGMDLSLPPPSPAPEGDKICENGENDIDNPWADLH